MHEWALAEAVVSTADRIARKEGLKKITKLKIRIGELQNLDTEIIEFALRELGISSRPLLKNVKIKFEMERGRLKCRACGNEWNFSRSRKDLSEADSEAIHFVPELAHSFVKCSRCKSPDFEVTKGRGIGLVSIEGT